LRSEVFEHHSAKPSWCLVVRMKYFAPTSLNSRAHASGSYFDAESFPIRSS
jgi:hypothetical protein